MVALLRTELPCSTRERHGELFATPLADSPKIGSSSGALVLAAVFTMPNQLEVIDSIIKTVAVDVVQVVAFRDGFAGLQPPKHVRSEGATTGPSSRVVRPVNDKPPLVVDVAIFETVRRPGL